MYNLLNSTYTLSSQELTILNGESENNSDSYITYILSLYTGGILNAEGIGISDILRLFEAEEPTDEVYNGLKARVEGMTVVDKIIIQEGVTEIGQSTFSGIGSSNELVLPNSVISIRDMVFSITSISIVLPDSLLEIGSSAFSSTQNKLITLIIPDSVSSIGGVLVEESLVENVYLPANSNITRLDFLIHAHNLKKIIIPQNITSIPESLLQSNSNLTLYWK